ncbi:DUF6383 domain-containing protein [uncultured Parabacteroides sp.]|uniref:DUF6383 domain-containing protein n=1 Tax=uncultured Parabacteroides sp. TaxID=512312 RepID=UPI0025EB5A1D|nr:DUF6383 domain-containing protein [uncultured Parabacteroides sp.]
MNKRFSTLMVAFMAIGSMLTSALAENAQAGRLVAAKNLQTGRAYYVATVATNEALVAADFFVGVTADGDNKITWATKAAQVDNFPSGGLKTTDQWFVEKDGSKIALKNAVNGAYIAFDEDGNVIANNEKVSETSSAPGKWFLPEGTALKVQGVAVAGKNYLKFATTNAITLDASTAVINFYEAEDASVELTALQAAEGDGFSLNFAEPLTGDSIFAKVSAVKVSHSGTADVYVAEMATSGDAFYLMTEGTAPADGFTIGTDAKHVDAFDKAKFIVLTTTRATGSQFADPANGYRYAVMTGKELAAELKKSDASIAAGNAQFTASTSLNQDGYILTQTDVKVSDAAASATVWVDKVNGFVASNVVDLHKSPIEIVAGKGTAVVVKDLVKGKMVVNVLVEKTQDERNFVSALGLSDDAGAVAVIDNKSNANLTLPAGQWLVSVADGNKIDLINLQNPLKKEEGAALYATANAGEYTVKGGSALDGKLIKFVTIANPSLYNGYLNLDDKDLAGKTFKLSAKASLLGMDIVAYLKANTPSAGNVGVTQLEEEATEWAIEKMTEGVTEGHSTTDTLYITTTYKSYDAEGALKEHKDEVIGIAFGYKLTAVGAADANSELKYDYSLGAADAGKTIMFKQVAAGKYAMVANTSDANVAVDDMNTKTNYAAIVSTTGILDNNTGDFSAAAQFTLTEVEPAPSFEATAEHVTFMVNGLNYVAMDKNFNGVVANETSELKAATAEDFTFWIDSINSDAVTPNFFISHAGMMMCDAQFVIDTIQAAEDNYDITAEEAEAMIAACKVSDRNRVKFVAAKRWAETDSLIIAGDTAKADAAFMFSIVEDENGGYLLKNGTNYVGTINNQLVMTTKDLATPVEVAAAEAPTANDAAPSVSEVKVIAQNGAVQIVGAQGKKVVVSNILGQTIANTVLTSSDATIAAPAGVVVVAVEGEEAVKAIVK